MKITFQNLLTILAQAAAVEVDGEWLAAFTVEDGVINIESTTVADAMSITEEDVRYIDVADESIIVAMIDIDNDVILTPLWRATADDMSDLLVEMENDGELDGAEIDD